MITDFTTVGFILFFALVYVAYWTIKPEKQNHLLLFTSYLFYGLWDYHFLPLLIGTTGVDYFCARKIASSISNTKKKIFLYLSLVFNLIVLFIFKYFNFFVSSTENLLSSLGINIEPGTLAIFMPLGLSFYTFQSISYTLDVYWQKAEPEKSVIKYGLYISFFPQLINGPIERSQSILNQLRAPRSFSLDNLAKGFDQFVFGIFMKCVIADNLSGIINKIEHGNNLIVKLYIGLLYFIQVYADFGGYTKMARGLSTMLGIDLSRNFNFPLFAKSPADFWLRWHMTFTSWIRSYLFIPVLIATRSYILALLIAMLFVGIWHGANIYFLLWAAYWSAIILIYYLVSLLFFQSRPMQRVANRYWAIPAIGVNTILTSYGFYLFRQAVLDGSGMGISTIVVEQEGRFGESGVLLILGLTSIFLVTELINYLQLKKRRVLKVPFSIKALLYILVFFLVRVFSTNSYNDFIYYQF